MILEFAYMLGPPRGNSKEFRRDPRNARFSHIGAVVGQHEVHQMLLLREVASRAFDLEPEEVIDMREPARMEGPWWSA